MDLMLVLMGGCWRCAVDWALFENLDLSIRSRIIGSNDLRLDRNKMWRRIIMK